MTDEKKLQAEGISPAPIEEEEIALAPIEEEEVSPTPVEEGRAPSKDDLDFGDLDKEFASEIGELAEDSVFSEDYGEYAKGFPDWDLLPPDVNK